jgi:phytoene synthase
MDAVYARILQQMLQVGWTPPRRRIKTNKLLLVATVLWLLVKN